MFSKISQLVPTWIADIQTTHITVVLPIKERHILLEINKLLTELKTAFTFIEKKIDVLQ